MTTVTVVTPAGRSAVATLLVRGAAAVNVVSQFFTPAGPTKLDGRTANAIAFGTWQHGDNASEDVVVSKRSSSAVEIHCHGGTAAVQSILNSLVEAGCSATSWQQLSRSTCSSPTGHDATLALANARTERTAGILLDQLRGALEVEIQAIIQDIEQSNASGATERLRNLRQRCDIGLHLTAPWKVVLAGAPNVGKSSLINALLGYQRAIVFDQPGTTRDVVIAETAINGWLVSLSDTAGIRESQDDIEQRGVEHTHSATASADLVIQVLDRALPNHGKIELPSLDDTKVIRVINKIDLDLNESVEHYGSSRPETLQYDLAVSALTTAGIPELLKLIENRLIATPPVAGEAIPFTQHHVAAIEAGLSSLEAEQYDAAISHLNAGFLQFIQDR